MDSTVTSAKDASLARVEQALAQKLLSRKFWAMVSAVLTEAGLLLSHQVDATAAMAAICVTVATYIGAEAYVDAKAL